MDNKRFWNERYNTLPQLGSGAASRGWAAVVKQEIFRRIIAANDIKTIIDIGCGDMCWYTEGILKDVEYIGVDISDVVIHKNKERFPSLAFIRQDISEDFPRDVEVDVCMCFDMLLHQCDERQFENALGNVLRITKKHGLISYPTTNDHEEAIYQMEITSEGQKAEAKFVNLLSQLSKDRPYGEVKVRRNFLSRILQSDPNVMVRRLTKYRTHPLEEGGTHTVYEISRTGEWLEFR
jgi:ubiquinone/menaquinone biosynthesis C-methylase UbiE